jgi:hypothetical protein
MKRRSITPTLAAMLVLPFATPARAAPPAPVQAEINFLLGYVEGSGCEFQRNGSWYASPAAQEHLRSKYGYLVGKDLIQSAEQFIDKAATASSISGQPYHVRCHGGPLITSQQWLRDELARLRSR